MPISALRLHRLLLVASFLVPGLVFAAASSWNYFEVHRETEDTVKRTAAILDEHARKVFDTVDLAIGRIDDRIKGKGWDEIGTPDTNAFLRGIDATLPQAVSIWITDRNGIHRAGTLDAGIGVDVSGAEWFQMLRDGNRGTIISPPFTGKATRRASFAVSRSRTTPDGEFDGAIVVSLSPEYFEGFFREASPPGPHVASLIRRDGIFLARIPERTEGMRLSLNAPLMRAIAEKPWFGMRPMVSTLDGRHLIFAYRKVGTNPVFVGFGIDRSMVLARWHLNVTVYAIVALLSSLTLCLVSLLAFRRACAEQSALMRLREEGEQRLIAEQRLRQSQKMEGLGQLTGGIAHDFNNLLAIIIGNLEMLQRQVRGDDKAVKLVERASRGAARGAALTQRLLAYSRRQDLSPQSISVPDLVAGMTDMMARSLGPGIRIETFFPPDLPPAKADPNQLEVALLNLAVNARDAMPSGGLISMTGRAATVGPEGMAGLQPGDYVCVSIRDTGTGMDEATLAKAVEPFFTTKGTGKGTGLGLSMVHGLAVQSGGTLRITSSPGNGTTAEMWLPRGEAIPDEKAARPLARPEALPFYRILLVDDDSLVLEATGAMLEELGHVVKSVASGKDAIDALLRDPSIQLVVTDYDMPGMTGLELAEHIRKRSPGLPILLASGHAEIPERAGLNVPRLTKPFRQEELADAILALMHVSDDCAASHENPRGRHS